MSADKQFEKLKDGMYERFYKTLPEVASFLGLHDPYDRQLSKGDKSTDREIEKILKESVHQMRESIDFDSLSDIFCSYV